tara:strand:+ start:387 stop:563 length:177 start_codon:yes stop_codon:yes gene_type:complete
MDKLIKDALPKEVIEVQEAFVPVEPESGGLTWGLGIGIVVGVVLAGSILKFGCKKIKK